MVNRREKEKRQLRYASAKERAEKQESSHGPSAIKLPNDVPLFAFKKAGVYRLSILPYVVGKGNRFADEGFVHYERTYWTHRIGTDNKQYCCLRENFNEPCPVCEYMSKLDRWGSDKDLYSSLRPKQRQLFAIEDLSEKGKGIQIFETNYYFGMGEFIDNKVKANPDKYGGFYHLRGGLILEVSVKQDSFEGRPSYKVKNIEMEVERKDLDDSVLDDVPCLDDLLIELPYKKMKEIFMQTSKGSADSDETKESDNGRGVSRTAPTTSARSRDNDDDGDDDDGDTVQSEYEIGERVVYKKKTYEVIKLLPDGNMNLEDDDGDIIRNIDPDDVIKAPGKANKPARDEDDDEDEDDEPPAKAKGRKAAKDEDEDEDEDEELDDEDEDEDEELDDDEDDEDEAPPAKAKGKAGKR